mgnify:CR=1 FL=1
MKQTLSRRVMGDCTVTRWLSRLVVDGLVEWEDNGVDAQALQYDRIPAIHNEAIKELSARVRELEARLAG